MVRDHDVSMKTNIGNMNGIRLQLLEEMSAMVKFQGLRHKG